LFNRDEHPMELTMDFQALGLAKTLRARDLWARKDLGVLNGNFSAQVPAHGSIMLKVSSAGQ
jgi:hypothetical protein